MSDTNGGGKSVKVAALLWFFLGWLGLHRFYLGMPRSGTVQLAWGIAASALSMVPPASLPHPRTAFIAWLTLGLWVAMDLMLIVRLHRDQRSRNQPVIA